MSRSRHDVGHLIGLMEFETRKLEGSAAALRLFNEALKTDAEGLRALQPNGLYWNIVTDSLRDATIITLGRLMDLNHDSLSARAFLEEVGENLSQLDRPALVERKMIANLSREESEAYAATAFVPTIQDVAILASKLDVAINLWDKHYKKIRHKQVAHRDAKTFEVGLTVVDDGDDKGVELMISTLTRISLTVWQWYHNGRAVDFDAMPSERETSHVGRDVANVLELLRLGTREQRRLQHGR